MDKYSYQSSSYLSDNKSRDSSPIRDKHYERNHEIRRKIDREIERRLEEEDAKQKKFQSAFETMKKISEKTSNSEEKNFQFSPFSTEKSRNKEVTSRLVLEKKMRNDKIQKMMEFAKYLK